MDQALEEEQSRIEKPRVVARRSVEGHLMAARPERRLGWGPTKELVEVADEPGEDTGGSTGPFRAAAHPCEEACPVDPSNPRGEGPEEGLAEGSLVGRRGQGQGHNRRSLQGVEDQEASVPSALVQVLGCGIEGGHRGARRGTCDGSPSGTTGR